MRAVLPNRILRRVAKPSRYVAGEWNQVIKDTTLPVRFALAFPDLYEIGMSNLALQLLYQLLNERDDTWCERVFQPADDLRAILVEEERPLFALESGSPLADFDFLGFSLQYELSYTTVLDMLELAGLAKLAVERAEQDPVVIAGGPCAVNLEPLALVFDLAVIGEAEELLPQIIDCRQAHPEKKAFLRAASALPGVYVPAFYDVVYEGLGAVFSQREASAPLPVARTPIIDLDGAFLPVRPLVPNQEIVHDRMVLELFRGCARGCRFCQAGMIYRPVRERSPERLLEQAEEQFRATGYDELGLLSLSTSDYRALGPLTDELLARLAPCQVSVSLPSLRLDSFDFELMKKAGSTRKSGLTFAPEAGTQRLRDRINKNIREEEILQAARLAFSGGWHHLKLYFMLGLPAETDADAEGIADLVFKILKVYDELPVEGRGRRPTLAVSVAYFVPKAWTPFQWEAQAPVADYERRCRLLSRRLRHRQIRFQWHDTDQSVIEALLARGDRRLLPVLLDVQASGGRLESWREHFSLAVWLRSLEKHGLTLADFLGERDPDLVLPWELIDVGVTRRHLLSERQAALAETLSTDCLTACAHCGAQRFQTGICLEHHG